MSDFKIIGNPNPVVGVLEFYTISDFFSEISPSQEFVYIPKSPENQVKWEVYVLEFGKWRKTKENDKTGKQVTYTFFEKSLTRKGIRLLARKGEKVARLDIKPLPAHPKIDHVELLDKNGSKITGRLAYGQTVKARVFCLNMEKRRVHVTLWEDDVKGARHSKDNEKNFIETRSAIVHFGKADIDFLLSPSFAKIATKGGPENDKIHEYYVTAEYNREKTASNNVNVNAPEAPVAPYKSKTRPKLPPSNTTANQPKKELPKSDKPPVAAPAKGNINSVNITDTSGHAIKGRLREKQIKVWINSSNLIGKEVRIKLFDDDYGKDDLLFQKEFTIQSNLHAIVVSLNTIPRSWGGNYLAEGNDQELFAEVEVLQTHAFTKSAIVDVDATVFKQYSFEIFNKVLKVDMPEKKEKKEENCGEKYCIKKGDKSDLIREINIRLAGFGGNVPTDEFTDRTEKMIKQFQRDYMKVPETGKICGNVLKAIDEFCEKWGEKITEYTCLCKNVSSIQSKCSGFGKGRYKREYSSSSRIERFHKYERPGIHRSLLWGISTLRFYISNQNVYKYMWKTAGYRCWEHNNSVPRRSTNHMGKAVDIQFSKNGVPIQGKKGSNISLLNEINEKFYSKYLKAKYQWVDGKNNFSIEPIGLSDGHTYSWIHLDVREFDNEYLDDKYFVKTQEKVINGSLLELAKKLGFLNTCMCNSAGNNSNKKPIENDSNNKRIDPKKLKTSGKGKQFIKDWEKFKPNLYNDDSEDHHCTIGYGHLVHLGPCNGSESQEFKNGITKERALQLFDLRLVDFEKAVQRDVTVPLYQYEFDALVSFLFNCGENFFVKKKAPKLHKHLLNKEYEEGAKEFLDVTSGGLAGLVKRRKAENNMFLNNIYDSKH
ncbi:glycoside hydrolase family protein [Flavobacterium saccharophilum]|uniref:Lysozyme n=1 Tax=Flavobacterium saccharophilum TaxID=29534 RepID=A0A1M7MB29_9FLAO|nr:glycoside hydrolase family protein [Flavobacterium saccharophilum]SHM88031.1 Phage-related lysozyme (muramidase), GH24 family [Flavobacterium saccharophilum]